MLNLRVVCVRTPSWSCGPSRGERDRGEVVKYQLMQPAGISHII